MCDTLQNGVIGWRRDDELLNQVIIFVFFAHKKYSRSFVNVTWTIVTISLQPFWALIVSLPSMEGQRALRMHQKYLDLCFEDERKSYGFGMTWGWVIHDRIFIFGWTIPLNEYLTAEKNRQINTTKTTYENMIHLTELSKYFLHFIIVFNIIIFTNIILLWCNIIIFQ